MEKLPEEKNVAIQVLVPSYIARWLEQREDGKRGLTRARIAASILRLVIDEDLEAHGEALTTHG